MPRAKPTLDVVSGRMPRETRDKVAKLATKHQTYQYVLVMAAVDFLSKPANAGVIEAAAKKYPVPEAEDRKKSAGKTPKKPKKPPVKQNTPKPVKLIKKKSASKKVTKKKATRKS